MLEVLNIKNADQIIKQQTEPPMMDPITENMMALQGKPFKVYAEQDHDAHLKVHASFMQDPQYQQFISQSPNAQAFQAAMQAHMAEHMAYSYRRAIEMKIGVSLPEQGQQLPPNVENDIAKLAVLGAQKLQQAHQQEAAQAKAQQEAQDPLNIIQRKELEIKERLAKVKEMEAEVDALVKANKVAMEYEQLGIKQRGEMLTSVKEAISIATASGEIMPEMAAQNGQQPAQPTPPAPPQVPVK